MKKDGTSERFTLRTDPPRRLIWKREIYCTRYPTVLLFLLLIWEGLGGGSMMCLLPSGALAHRTLLEPTKKDPDRGCVMLGRSGYQGPDYGDLLDIATGTGSMQYCTLT